MDESNSEIRSKTIHDDLYTDAGEHDTRYVNFRNDENDFRNVNLHSMSLKIGEGEDKVREFDDKMVVKNRVKREESDPRCETFSYVDTKGYITHPHKEKEPDLYYNNSDCTTVVSGKFI